MKDLIFRKIKIPIPYLFLVGLLRVRPSEVELRARYITVVAAKSLTLDLTCSGRSEN